MDNDIPNSTFNRPFPKFPSDDIIKNSEFMKTVFVP